MNRQPLVSVVVPVYNAEKYLKECVDSIVNQTLRDIEIIFVDDGSTDASLSILRDYQKDDSRIQIYTQKNQYAGVARNNGMDHATGKYIIFLDADDFFELNMLEEMYDAAENNNAEIVFCGHKVFDTLSDRIIETVYPNKEGLFNAAELGENIFSNMLEVPWNKLLLKKFVEDSGLKYQELRSANDVFFNKMILLISNKILLTKRAYVSYRVNNRMSLQGLSFNSEPCFGKALVKIKMEMDRRVLWSKENRYDFFKWCESVIVGKISSIHDKKRKELFFHHCKHTVDNLISTEIDYGIITHNKEMSILYKSSNFEEYLFLEWEELEKRVALLKKENMSMSYQLERIQKSTTYKISSSIVKNVVRIKVFFAKKGVRIKKQ